MADNVSVTPGTGLSIAADDIGGIMYQRVKIGIGADGAAADLSFGQQTKSASIPVVLPTDQGTLTVSQIPRAYDTSATFTRPANMTPYTAKDVVGTTATGVLTFTIGPVGGSSIMINGASIEIDVDTIPSGMTTFRLYMYNAAPTSPYTDNLVWDLNSVDRNKFIGYIDLGTPQDLGTTLYNEVNSLGKQVIIGTSNLYGYLVTTGAFTPLNNSEVYTITLHAVTL